MLKRIFPIIAVLVLLVSVFAIPSYAIGTGQPDTEYYSSLNFDVIEYDSDQLQKEVSIPFPFSSGLLGGEIIPYSFGDNQGELGYGYQGTTSDISPLLVGSLTLPSLSNDIGASSLITFKGGNQVVDLQSIKGFTISFDNSKLRVSQASYTVTYYDVVANTDTDYYESKSSAVTNYLNVVNDDIFVGDAISSYFGDRDYLFIAFIRIDIYFERLTSATTRFEFEIPTGSMRYMPSYFRDWLDDQDAVITEEYFNPAYFNPTSWLNTAIGSFLSFEILPGFSIDSIFYILLVIGVLIWFIRVVS